MRDDEWGPDEGVPEVPGEAREIDITDAALARSDSLDADGGADRAGFDDVEPTGDDDLPEPGLDRAPHAGSADAGTADADDATAGLLSGHRDVAGIDDAGPDETGAHDTPTPPLRKILESILLVVDQPVPEVELAQVLETPRATVLAALEDLSTEYERDGRGFELRQVAGGWRLYTTPDCAPYVERFALDGQQARLTQAALETLAVVAYRQPVSRQAIAAIRGVNVDGVIRTLLTRGLITEAGEEGPSGAHLYVTTPYFLERLGLRSLDELPNLAPLLPANVDDLVDGV